MSLTRQPEGETGTTAETKVRKILDTTLHPANPYVAGAQVRQFILSRVPTRSREQALISMIGRYWRLFEAQPLGRTVARYGVGKNRAENGKLTGRDLDRILKKIDAIGSQTGRTAEYRRLLRPAGLRRWVIKLMGANCQVEDCDAAQSNASDWKDPAAALSILDVHHIESVAKVEDHSPKNLSVLCANHHRLIHGFGPWALRHDGDDIIFRKGRRKFRIVRDLSGLQRTQS